jgi:hypothetical protein
LRTFTNAFESYLIKKISTKNVSQFIQKNLDKNNLKVISFNYTDTFSRVYNNNSNIVPEDTSIYVHGKIDGICNDCKLVLGTKSFDRYRINNGIETKGTDSDLPVDLNIFQKHNQRHKYGTIEKYQKFLREIKDSQEPMTFHVIGHSLDEADHNILKHIFMANKNAEIKIYYHNVQAHDKLIRNITNIIGEEEVMARVRFIGQDDTQNGLLIGKS